MKQDDPSSGTFLHKHLLINCRIQQLTRGEVVKCFYSLYTSLDKESLSLSLWACEARETGLAPLCVIYGQIIVLHQHYCLLYVCSYSTPPQHSHLFYICKTIRIG